MSNTNKTKFSLFNLVSKETTEYQSLQQLKTAVSADQFKGATKLINLDGFPMTDEEFNKIYDIYQSILRNNPKFAAVILNFVKVKAKNMLYDKDLSTIKTNNKKAINKMVEKLRIEEFNKGLTHMLHSRYLITNQETIDKLHCMLDLKQMLKVLKRVVTSQQTDTHADFIKKQQKDSNQDQCRQ